MAEPLPLDVSPDNYATVALADDAAAVTAVPSTQPPAAAAADENANAAAAAAAVKDAEDAQEDADPDDQAAVSQKRERRTELTDAEFLAQKESYTAKVEVGDIWKELTQWMPAFSPSSAFLSGTNTPHNSTLEASPPSDTHSTSETSHDSSVETPHNGADVEQEEKQKIDKKQHQALQAAVAELYWKGEFVAVLEIVRWARRCYLKDGKFEVQLSKWEHKAGERLDKSQKAGGGER